MNPTINVTFAIGDRVTPENVAALPVGTIVQYDCDDRRLTATKIGPDTWEDSDGDMLDDGTIADPNEPPAIIVSIGPPPDRLTEHVAAVTPQYRERARAWLAAEHVDMVEELAALLATVSGESCA